MRVLVIDHTTLDGVVQGPGRLDEDTRDGFTLGGWAEAGAGDPAIGAAMGGADGRGVLLLFGRRSYEDMLGRQPGGQPLAPDPAAGRIARVGRGSDHVGRLDALMR